MKIVRIGRLALAVSALAFTACSNESVVTSPEARLNVDVAAAPPGTVLVLPGGGPNVFTNGWRGYGDRSASVGTSSIVTNPSFPGSGLGSLAITNTSSAGGWEVAAFHSPPGGLAGTRLDAVTRLEYSTYTATQASVSAILQATLQFTADFDLNDAFTGFEGRLVYEPYHCNATALDTWTTWNTMDGANTGCWFTSRASVTKNAPSTIAVPAASACPQANPCTWSEVLTAYPNAGFRLDASLDPSTLLPANRSLILKTGSTWTGTFNADNVSIATSGGVDTTYDFEPEPIPDTEAPVVSIVAVTPNPAPVTTLSYTLTANATDNVAVTSASYTIDGGAPVAFTFSAGTLVSLSASIGPMAVGVYDLCVTAKDAATNTSDTECTMLAVYDPSAGFVTGGGWFMSPAGAYAGDLALTGKATFGFVSKYVKGKTLPTGNTEFHFQAGGLSFSSTAYEWLVVNQAGMNAQFKGVGSLNGVAGHKFMIWAKDGTPDTFRIQITDGSGTTVYDNKQQSEFGSTLGGGNIMIHIPK